MRILKVAGVVVGVLLLAAVAAAVVVYVKTEARMARKFDVPVQSIPIPTDEASIARGRHLADSIGGCTQCHGADLAGKVEDDIPMLMRLSTPNITAGEGGVTKGYTDTDWLRAVRHGVSRDGHGLLFMPANAYANLNTADVGAIIAAVKTFPPVDKPTERPTVRIIGRVLMFTDSMPMIAAETLDHAKPAPEAVSFATAADHGRYLVTSGGCADCHREDLAGGHIKGTPADFPPAANLTPAGPLATYQDAEFITLFRTGKRPDGRQLADMMPWKAFGRMTDEELTAVFAYLKTLPATETHQD